MKKKILLFLCFCGLVLIASMPHNLCKQSKNLSSESNLNNSNVSVNYFATNTLKIDSIIDFGKSFLNKPYKYKGPSSWAMDCSGYIAFIFSKFGFKMPHSAISIGTIVKNLKIEEIRKGDLLFFKGRNVKSNSIGHVSMVVEVINGKIKMMHSCSRGIIIEEYDKIAYYTQRFIKAGRLPFDLDLDLLSSLDIDKSATLQITKNQDDSISIIGVGDMMLGTNFPSESYLPPNDGKDILTPVTHIIQKADIAFGNLEGAILSDKGTVKTCSNPNVCYAFKMPDHYVNYFKDAGFDILSLANNHVGDFGDKGKENTVKQLKEAEIIFAGITKYPFTTFERNGIKYGFCAFSPNNGTININDSKNAATIVKHLDSICDIVIVSFHGGAEGSAHTHITKKNELFLGENRGNPYEFSRLVIDAGADVVFGHGPHVTRAIDLYKNRFIIYSMGNFATYGRFNIKGVCGLAPIVKLYVNKKGEFKSGEIISTKQLGEGGPILDPTNAVLEEIIKLTASDIPNVSLNIQKNGRISLK
jgi:hypothetical protein